MKTNPHVVNTEPEEFFKLDRIDRKVLFWLLEHVPHAVKSWIDYTAREYRATRAVKIDAMKLQREVTGTR